MPNPPSRWQPYCHRPDAEFHLSKFAGEVLGHDAGVIFFDGSGAARLKSAHPDKDGDTTDLVVSVQRPPLFPLAFSGRSGMQSSGRPAQGSQPMALHQTGRVLADLTQTRKSVANFIEGHKTAFDGASTVFDVVGTVSGVLALVALVGGTVAVAPAVLGIMAGAASLLLLKEDGQMFYYEVTGDEMHKQQLANSWSYRMVESVAPWLALPDLFTSGLSTVRETAQTASKVTALTARIETTTARLASQREAIDSYREAHATKLSKPNIVTKVQRMRAKANKLDSNLLRAQSKLSKARRELVKLGAVGLPSYAGTIYGAGTYSIDPPDVVNAWQGTRERWRNTFDQPIATHDPHHPVHLLVPAQTASYVAGDVQPVMQLQVAVRPKSGASR
ncbi:MAG: hypothetical protein ACTHNZ_23820 [Trinickia sp.]|uniref:hypothetical protein n=1 Tax=Trinickia sp. TaxID=2571163 RepID=UPI003F7F4AD9